MNRSTFCEIKYMNGLCFKGQVGFEIRMYWLAHLYQNNPRVTPNLPPPTPDVQCLFLAMPRVRLWTVSVMHCENQAHLLRATISSFL